MSLIKNKYSRLASFFDEETLSKIQEKKVLIIGLGGVGGYVVEALARCGIKHLTLVDGDKVEETNFNRQLIALDSNLNKFKTECFKERIFDIDKDIEVNIISKFISKDNIDILNIDQYDLILDLIDDSEAKASIIIEATKLNKRIISCMGTGNKTDPFSFKIGKLNQTSYCPLAKVMRNKLKGYETNTLEVCYSQEPPKKDTKVSSLMYVVNGASLLIVKRALELLALN